MLRITSITPEYEIDRNDNSSVKKYLVKFRISKTIKGERMTIMGFITYRSDDLNLRTIEGKILFELKNILSNGI